MRLTALNQDDKRQNLSWMDFDRIITQQIMTLKVSDIADSNSPLINGNLATKYSFENRQPNLLNSKVKYIIHKVYKQTFLWKIQSCTLIALTLFSKKPLSERPKKEQTSN